MTAVVENPKLVTLPRQALLQQPARIHLVQSAREDSLSVLPDVAHQRPPLFPNFLLATSTFLAAWMFLEALKARSKSSNALSGFPRFSR
ncbi:MAG TPA: hypothetical protein DCQ16_05005 [Spirochaetaceae bacterium]|nr:hypothetical protein [Spirochaetaceae bacterium]